MTSTTTSTTTIVPIEQPKHGKELADFLREQRYAKREIKDSILKANIKNGS